MPIKSIEINANPVTAWETYHRTLYPAHLGYAADYLDYDREIEADGVYGRLRFKIPGTRPELEEFFELGLGRDVQVFNDRGGHDYHGFILGMVLNTRYHLLRKSLQNVFNRVWARFDDSGGVNPTRRSNYWNNEASQARFGIIEKVIGGGQQADLSAIDQAVQNRLDWFAWPMIDPDFDAGSEGPYIEIIAVGYQHTMKWRVYNQVDLTGDANISTVAEDVLTKVDDDLVPICQFIYDYEIATNVIQVPREYDVDLSALDVLGSLAEMGDSAGNRWLSRVEAGRIYKLGPGARIF
jgi:hypothetical protein